MGTESLGMIGCIFAENGPLEGGIESSFWGTGWGAKGDFMRYSYLYPYIFESRTHTFFESTCPELYAQQSWEWSDAYSWRNDLWKVNFKRVCKKPAGVLMVIWSGFLAPKRSFSKGAPTISRKHMPSGMGTESLGMIGCIFAENGPLEGGIESSFWGTGWGAKGDFMRYSYLYPYIFESRTHTFFESTCPELYAQQSWEWSDAYSWRNDLWKVNFKRVCKKPAGVLMVIWSGFLAPKRSFSKGVPHHFPKVHALRYGHRKFGNDRMYIRGEWALRRWHWIKFLGYRLGCLGWIQMDFWPQSVHFRRGPPTIFRKHMPSGMDTESLGMIGCIFAENGPLEGGTESSFWGTGWGAKGEFRWIFGPNPCIFEWGPPPFPESTCPQVWAQKVWEWSDVYSRRMGP